MNMHSQQKTPVAVLRQQLGLNAEDFARLIGKSLSTVTKLENELLKLSEETAFEIADQTGVAMEWLLDASLKEKPYFFDPIEGKQSWNRYVFENVQADKNREKLTPERYKRQGHKRAWELVSAISVALPWVSVYTAAAKAGKDELAVYLMGQFLEELTERLGCDDERVLRLNKKAKLISSDGIEWSLKKLENGKLTLSWGDEYIYTKPDDPEEPEQ